MDPIYLESSYYMAPQAQGEKPYALLFEALRQAGYWGIAKLAMHSREHVVILRPGEKGILLHTMYYNDEIRKVDEFRTEGGLVKAKELELAKLLIEALVEDFDPSKYHDTYRENLQKIIEAKIGGHKVVATPQPHLAPVMDIMEALRKSLAEKKKPARSAQEPVPIRAPRKRRAS